jgi:dethiobiotin synthetase
MRKIFVSGIGTGIGKTLIAALLTERLKADYWKPVQAGNLDDSDTDLVKRLVSNTRSVFHPETFRLTAPMSPHAAAEIDGIKIRLQDFKIPETNNNLIIEGAGGLLVPLSNELFVIDLITYLDAEVVLVSQNYLGSINHTLLSAEALKARNINVTGIIFNGETYPQGEQIILQRTGLRCLARVPQMNDISRESIKLFAKKLVL